MYEGTKEGKTYYMVGFLQSTIQQEIFDKYGGAEHLLVDDETKRLISNAQTDQYVEYSRKGEVLKGMEKAVVRSRYDEDVYVNNHTAIFGSFWSSGAWGYKCCHSTVKNSYCIGDR